MLPPDALFPTVRGAALFKQLVRACECSAGFCCDVEGSLLCVHPVFGMMVRTPPACPTTLREATLREATPNMRHDPICAQVHPISNDTQLALQSVCAARKVLILHAEHKLLVCRCAVGMKEP